MCARRPACESRLADLFNGVPEGHPAVNVALHRGKWPFIRGGRYKVGESDIHCTAVALTRDVDAGDELIYSYGDASTTGFVLKFGAVPTPLDWRNPNEEVDLLVGYDGGGNAPDVRQLREKALRSFGLQPEEMSLSLSEEELGADDASTDDDEGDDEGGLAAVRLYGMLRAGGEPFLRACLRAAERGLGLSNGTRSIHAEISEMQEDIRPAPEALGRQLVEMVDANLRRLPTSSTARDREALAKEDVSPLAVVALGARVRQREQLLRWRVRFCKEYGLPASAGETSLDVQTLQG